MSFLLAVVIAVENDCIYHWLMGWKGIVNEQTYGLIRAIFPWKIGIKPWYDEKPRFIPSLHFTR